MTYIVVQVADFKDIVMFSIKSYKQTAEMLKSIFNHVLSPFFK